MQIGINFNKVRVSSKGNLTLKTKEKETEINKTANGPFFL